jgi:hypothetical protein
VQETGSVVEHEDLQSESVGVAWLELGGEHAVEHLLVVVSAPGSLLPVAGRGVRDEAELVL